MQSLYPDERALYLDRFRAVSLGEFTRGKPPAWIIKGILPQAELGVLFGESGSGKSFMALDMAVDIAIGASWRGLKTRQCRVGYVAAEGANGIRTRARAIATYRGLDIDQIPIAVIPEAPNIMERSDAINVASSINKAGGADLIIIDTFAQVMPGANENSGEDVGQALRHCKDIHRETGALVLLVHHSGKDASRGARGWSGLRAAADVELEIIRSNDMRTIRVTKQKDGEDGAHLGFTLEPVSLGYDEDGDEITSCVVKHNDRGTAVKDYRGLGINQMLFIKSLEELTGASNEWVSKEDLLEAVIKLMPPEDKQDRSTSKQRAVKSLAAVVTRGLIEKSAAGYRLTGNCDS